LIHRDYLFPANVQINISPDKVEIINPGKLLFPIEELGKRNVLRNPILVDLAHRLGLVEKAGSGIKRMKKMMDEEGLEMEFEVGTYFSTIFHRRTSDAHRTQIGRRCKANAKQMQSKAKKTE